MENHLYLPAFAGRQVPLLFQNKMNHSCPLIFRALLSTKRLCYSICRCFSPNLKIKHKQLAGTAFRLGFVAWQSGGGKADWQLKPGCLCLVLSSNNKRRRRK